MLNKQISRRSAGKGVAATVAVAASSSVLALAPTGVSTVFEGDKIVALSNKIIADLDLRASLPALSHAKHDAWVRSDLAELRTLWYQSPRSSRAGAAQSAAFRKSYEILGRTIV